LPLRYTFIQKAPKKQALIILRPHYIFIK